jgi:hypothetical protein
MFTPYNVPEGVAGNLAETAGEPQAAPPKTGSTIKENLMLTGNFLVTLVKKAADIVDNNPAKVALGLAKAIIDITEVSRRSPYRLLTDLSIPGCERQQG